MRVRGGGHPPPSPQGCQQSAARPASCRRSVCSKLVDRSCVAVTPAEDLEILVVHCVSPQSPSGGVPRGRPAAGQLSGTPLCAWLTHLTLCVPVLGSRGLSPSRSPALQLGPQRAVRVACGRQKVSRWSPSERVTSIREVRTSRQGETEGAQGQDRLERCLHSRPRGRSPRLFRACRISMSHPQHISHRITDSPWRSDTPNGSRLQHHGYRC
jgi:hypothetical protein